MDPQIKFEVAVEKLVYGGEGLGRVGGRVVLMPFVLPGETALAAAEQERPGLIRARTLEVLAASPERVEAPCPYFGRCGGCHYQHAPYELQLNLKRAILQDVVRRIGKFEPPAEIAIVSGEPWNYRNRSQFHTQGNAIGYLEMGSHHLCAVEQCPISSPVVNSTLIHLWGMLRDPRWPRFVRSLEVFTNERDVQLNILDSDRPVARRFFEWCAEQIPGFVSGALEYPAAGTVFRVGSRSFFQVNRYLTDGLVETALEGAGGESALDLYAGAGLFSVPLARRFSQVTAVESGAGAIRDLEFNAQRAGVTVSAIQSRAEEFLAGLEKAPDFMLLDPPRAGIGKRMVHRIAELRPERVAIVSCDPSTLARDLAPLLASGYQLDSLTLVDLFPQTYHMETVARLRR